MFQLRGIIPLHYCVYTALLAVSGLTIAIIGFFQHSVGLVYMLYIRIEHFHTNFRLARSLSTNIEMAQLVHLLDYYYRLETNESAKRTRKLAYIRNEDPYVLNTSNLCKDVSHLPALR